VELPPKYYHENFEYLLSFVKEKYGHLLSEEEWRFLRKYYSLPEDAQCLFIRFCNRKGIFFREGSLSYAEIEDIPAQIGVLKERGFIQYLAYPEHSYFVKDLLQTLTKNELLKCFPEVCSKQMLKEEIMHVVLEKMSIEELFKTVSFTISLLKVNFEHEVSFLKFLFFGNRSMDMTEFVIRDLGLIQYHKTSEDDLVARFQTRKEAEDKWLISEQFLVFEEIKSHYSAHQVYDWYCSFRDEHKDLSTVAIPSFQRLQLNIGRFLERHKNYELALEVYEDAEVPPSRERRARCLAKAKFFDEARVLCEEMISAPYNVDEQYFAEYFLPTLSGKKNKKHTTLFLKEAEEIHIPAMYKHQVELGSLEYFLEKGYSGSFSENFSWRALFGLWMWDIIFDPSLVAFHHPFQRRPSDLYLPDFYFKREQQVEERLQQYENAEELVLHLWEVFEREYGTANPFVVWDVEIWSMVRVLVTRIDLQALRQIMRTMAMNLVENSRGMPDLLIWDEETYELIEIKSPNDALSHQQLYWLKTFQELGIKARVLRVKFEE
jgi:hypothetical protein